MLAAFAVFLMPGGLFVRAGEWERAEPIELCGVVFCGSAAFWAVSFWALRWIPLSFRAFATGAIVGSLLVVTLRLRGRRAALTAWRGEPLAVLAQALFVAVVLALRLLFASTHVAYSGGDMTAHAAMAERIVMADGFPVTQEPLLPIPRFGQFPPGFHALSALVTLLSGLPTYRSTILVFCFAMAAMTFALYAFLRALELPRACAAAGSAAALFLARNPQFFLQWGGAPSILAAALGLLLLREALCLGEESALASPMRAGLLGAGVLLAHPLPAVGLVWILPPVLLVRRLFGHGSGRDLARNAGLAALLALVLATPFLASAPRSPSLETIEWARGWLRAETGAAIALEQRFMPAFRGVMDLRTWPFFLVAYLGPLSVLLLLGLVAGVRGARREAATIGITILAVQTLLFAGAVGEFLPGWPALYPTRTALWLVIPLALATGEIAARARLRTGAAAACGLAFAVAFGLEGWRLSASRFGTAFYGEAKSGRGSAVSVLSNEAAGGAFWVATFCRDDAAVTREDLAALEWVRARTRPDAVFANNPGDGGGLLPAAAHRKILEPHYYWFFDGPDVEAWRAKTGVDYVYVGAEPAPAWARRWRAEELDRDARVELVHESGRARVYRIRIGFGSGFR